MTDLTQAAILHIQDTSAAAKRQAVITLSDGSGRVLVYNDGEKKYDDLARYVVKSDTVSNIESFADMVIAEAQRRGQKNHVAGSVEGDDGYNPNSGEFMNVIFTERGATFIADTNDRRDVFYYQRKPSVHWELLVNALDKQMAHKAFLIWLEKLRPIIGTVGPQGQFQPAYNDIASAFRALRLSQSSKMLSEPLLNDGGAKGSTIEFKLEVRGQAGGVDVQIPQLIPVSVQFARGDKRRYEFDVAIDINGGEGDQPIITPYAPAVTAIQEQAIIDEMMEFDAATQQLPKLLNVVNF